MTRAQNKSPINPGNNCRERPRGGRFPHPNNNVKKSETILQLLVLPLACLLAGVAMGFLYGQGHGRASQRLERPAELPDKMAERLHLTDRQRMSADAIIRDAAEEVGATVNSAEEDVQRISAACAADLQRVIGQNLPGGYESEVRAILTPASFVPDHRDP